MRANDYIVRKLEDGSWDLLRVEIASMDGEKLSEESVGVFNYISHLCAELERIEAECDEEDVDVWDGDCVE